MPGTQPTVEMPCGGGVMPMSGSRSQAASTSSRFIIGSPMPMNTRWSSGLHAAEVQRLVEDLRGGQVARRTSSSRSRRTCTSAGSRTARRRRPSGGRRGSASAPPRPGGRRRSWNSALTVPSRGVRLAHAASSVENGTLARPARSRSAGRQVGHLLVAARAARRPSATPGGRGSAGSPASASVCVEQLEIHRRPIWWQRRCASPSTSPTRASPRAAPPSSSSFAGRVTRRRRGRHRPGARRRRRASASRSTARRSRGRERRVVYALNKPVGVVSTAQTRRAARRSSTLVPAPAPVPGRPPRRRHAPG